MMSSYPKPVAVATAAPDKAGTFTRLGMISWYDRRTTEGRGARLHIGTPGAG